MAEILSLGGSPERIFSKSTECLVKPAFDHSNIAIWNGAGGRYTNEACAGGKDGTGRVLHALYKEIVIWCVKEGYRSTLSRKKATPICAVPPIGYACQLRPR